MLTLKMITVSKKKKKKMEENVSTHLASRHTVGWAGCHRRSPHAKIHQNDGRHFQSRQELDPALRFWNHLNPSNATEREKKKKTFSAFVQRLYLYL